MCRGKQDIRVFSLSSNGGMQVTPENQINIAMASDSRFAPGMLVTAGSLALHARLGSRLRLTILDCGLTEKDRADLRSLIFRIRPDTTIEFIHPDLSRFASLPTWRGNYATYARLLLHEILSDDYVIYVDVDICWTKDCGELWDMRDVDHACWAPSNSLDLNMDRSTSFSPGTCMMNLTWLRRNDFTGKMAEWSKGKSLEFPDLEILNGLLSKDTVIIDSIWGMQEPAKWEGAFARPCVMHYSRNKPWLASTRDPYTIAAMPWWRFYLRFLGLGHSVRISLNLIRGYLKFRLFSVPGFISAYASLRGLTEAKRERLADMYLKDTPRNRNWWIGTYMRTEETEPVRFIEQNENVHIVHLYPVIGDEMVPAIIDILAEHGTVVCRRDIHLTICGIVQCERISYSHLDFGGSADNGFHGYWKHAKKSVGKFCRPTRIIVVSETSNERMRAAKEAIRRMVGLGIESVHITDTKEEAIALSRIYFNPEALCVFNATSRWYSSVAFDRMVERLKEKCRDANLPVEGVCGVGSTPMAVAGFRKARDFDFLASDARYKELEDDTYSLHDTQLRYYGFPKEILFSDNSPTFHYRGVKFLSLPGLMEMKRRRAEWSKDFRDRMIVRWGLLKGALRDFFYHIGRRRR
jgi:lipopolysaccharide biosynthesis glycosyltransferase